MTNTIRDKFPVGSYHRMTSTVVMFILGCGNDWPPWLIPKPPPSSRTRPFKCRQFATSTASRGLDFLRKIIGFTGVSPEVKTVGKLLGRFYCAINLGIISHLPHLIKCPERIKSKQGMMKLPRDSPSRLRWACGENVGEAGKIYSAMKQKCKWQGHSAIAPWRILFLKGFLALLF